MAGPFDSQDLLAAQRIGGDDMERDGRVLKPLDLDVGAE